MAIKIALGADHAGFSLKAEIATHLTQLGYEVTDLGTYSEDAVDYPDFAHAVANSVETGISDYGILICGSGLGVSIAANRHAGIRAGLAWNTEIAELTRQHNDANILCIGARFIAPYLAKKMVTTFLSTPFAGGTHANRLQKLNC
jgi:ribose 5-phosphate isomerase B